MLFIRKGSYEARAKRVIALDFPTLPLIPWVVLGQCAVYFWHAGAGFLSILIVFLSASSWRAFPFFFGLIPALFYYDGGEPSAVSDAELVVEVASPIRRRIPGEVRFNAKVLENSDSRAPKVGSKIQCRAVELPWRNGSALSEGDVISIRGDFSSVPYPLNPFSFDANLLHEGVVANCKARFIGVSEPKRGLIGESRELIRSKVMRIGSGGEDSGLLLSLVFGSRDVVTERTERAFRETGLSHLLVASGYQVTLIFGAFVLLLKLCLTPEVLRNLSSLLFAWVYVAISGGDSSLVRAGAALTLYVLFGGTSRNRGLTSVTIATIFISLILWPGCMFSPGLNLSFGALFGIALGDSMYKGGFYRYLSVSFYATLCASLVSLLWFGEVSPISLLLNLFLPAIVSPIACIGGLIGVGLSFLGIEEPLLFVLHLSSLFRDFVVWVAGFGLTSGKLGLFWRTVAALPMGWIVWDRYRVKRREYAIERGLD